MSHAVILLSGGLDSATTCAIAIAAGYELHALSFDYGQRHRVELAAAQRVAAAMGVCDHRIVALDPQPFAGSALTDEAIAIPAGREHPAAGAIPATYVPARNTIFLSCALGLAEVLDCTEIFIGVNARDYSGYPDCRPEFLAAFERLAALGTRAGVEGTPIRIRAPLLELGKAEIVRRGVELGVDFSLTVSCYAPDADGAACGRCEACHLRRRGFEGAGVPDPTRYARGTTP
jgi:7-cyano-7-deazaguanine synthase